MDINEYREKIRNFIINTIKNDLTIGRIDNELKIIEINDINNFIIANDNKIEEIMNKIISDYEKDGELYKLKDFENDWITEYMYDNINYEIFNNY
jgi:hypothetical protein